MSRLIIPLISVATSVALATDLDPWITTPYGQRRWNPVAAYNQQLDTEPPERLAHPILMQVVEDFPELMLDDNRGRWAWSVTPELWWDSYPAWDDQVKLLNAPRIQRAIALLMEAATRPRMGARLDDNWDEEEGAPILQFVYVPEVSILANACRLLTTAASARLEANEPDAAINLIKSMIDAHGLCQDDPTGFAQFIQSANYANAMSFIDWALKAHPEKLNDDHFAALDAILDRSFSIDASAPRIVFEDLVRRPADEPGQPSDLPLEKLPKPVREVVAAYDSTLRCAERPFGVTFDLEPWRCRTIDDLVREAHPDFRDDLRLSSFNWDTLRRRIEQMKQGQHALRLAVAAHRHRIRHAEFPILIEVIDHDLLQFEPVDMFTSQELQYRVVDGHPLIYTVGADRDDDGGYHNRDAIHTTNRTVADGDYVLFGAWPD